MKKVSLLSMKMENFKGIHSLEVTFGKETQVSGGNGSGKTSLYEAYLWCLFGKNASGNTFSARPLTNENKLVHNVDIAVELKLLIDDETPVTLRKVESEIWQTPRGKSEPVLKGNSTQYYYNEAPVSQTEYQQKLNSICKVEDWFMLSSIRAFMGLKTEDRRIKLQSIAEIKSDLEIAEEYPIVLKMLKEGKSLKEIAAQVKKEKKALEDEQKEIPVRIDAQDKLRSDEDFEAIEKEIEEKTNRANELEASLTALVSEKDIDRAAQVRGDLTSISKELVDIEDEIKRARSKRIAEFDQKIASADTKIAALHTEKQQAMTRKAKAEQTAADKKKKLQEKGALWDSINGTQYVDEVKDVCPTCNRPLPEDEVYAARENAIKEYNESKLKRLADIEEDAKRLQTDIAEEEQTAKNEEQNIDSIDRQIAGQQEIKTSAEKAKQNVPSVELTLSAKIEYQNLLTKKQETERQIRILSEPTKESQEAEAKKANLRAERDELNTSILELRRKLAKRDTNTQIDAEKARLEERRKFVSQELANAEQIEDQIVAFRKAKITMANESISSKFTMVYWKMYEPNLTNDDEREICQAIIDGVPYESQNTATQFNAAIDIISGLSKAYDVCLPLFIDQKESVTHVRETESQLVTLEVKADAPLNIITIKD